MPTSFPFDEGARKQPHIDGVFHKSLRPAAVTDAFKRMKNHELEKLRSAHVKATNLGPGVSQMTLDTFRLLKSDPILNSGQDNQKNIIKEGLSKKVDSLLR